MFQTTVRPFPTNLQHCNVMCMYIYNYYIYVYEYVYIYMMLRGGSSVHPIDHNQPQ